MVSIAMIPTLFAIAGLATWFVSKNPKVAEMGKLMFFAGLWVSLTLVSGRTIKF